VLHPVFAQVIQTVQIGKADVTRFANLSALRRRLTFRPARQQIPCKRWKINTRIAA
jgi:hypothetical protein